MLSNRGSKPSNKKVSLKMRFAHNRATHGILFSGTASFNDILLTGRNYPLVHLLVARLSVPVAVVAVLFGRADFPGAFNAMPVAHYSPQCKVGEHV